MVILVFFNVLKIAKVRPLVDQKEPYNPTIGFLHISCEALIHAIPKTWEKWISIVRKKYGKTQTFQIFGFLKFFG